MFELASGRTVAAGQLSVKQLAAPPELERGLDLAREQNISIFREKLSRELEATVRALCNGEPAFEVFPSTTHTRRPATVSPISEAASVNRERERVSDDVIALANSFANVMQWRASEIV